MKLNPKALLAAAFTLLFSWQVHAEPIDVTKLTDSNDGICDADCSLREAVIKSNTNGDTDNTINLTIPGTYVLTIKGTDDLAATGDLDILSDAVDILPKNVTIQGLGANVTIIDASLLGQGMGADPDRLFHVPLKRAPQMIPNPPPPGDNIVNLTINDVQLTGGFADGLGEQGGAIFFQNSMTQTETLIINDSWLKGNRASSNGGAVAAIGSFPTNVVTGIVINNSLMNGNVADSNGGAISLFNANAEISNSTISGNGTLGQGGAIFNQGDDQLTRMSINSSTIFTNLALGSGGGVVVLHDGADPEPTDVTITNTILAGNNSAVAPECIGTGAVNFNSTGFNIFGNLTGCSLAFIGSDQIGVLANTVLDTNLVDNGGPTLTHALLANGFAIDQGNPAGCFNGNGDPNDLNNTELLTDQRLDGFARISGDACDVGAFEFKQSADLTITKIADKQEVQVGENLVYTVTVTNNGPSTAANVVVQDMLSPEMEIVSFTPGDPICQFLNNVVTCTFDEILSGASEVITIEVKIIAEPDNNIVTNVATGTSNEDDPVPGDNTVQLDIPVPDNGNNSNLAIVKIANADQVLVGENLSYTLTVTNNGPDTATNVVVVDDLPPEVEFVSSDPGEPICTLLNDKVICTFASILANQSEEINIVVKVVSQPPNNVLTNSATTSSGENDPDPDDNSTSIDIPVPGNAGESDLHITKIADKDQVLVGEELTYTIEVTNNGPDDATNVQVVDDLPPEVEFISVTPAECAFQNGDVVCNFPSIAQGEVEVIEIKVKVIAEPADNKISNTATSTSDDNDPNPGDNTTTIDTDVPDNGNTSDLKIVKIANADQVEVGDDLTYTLKVTNNGPDQATNVVVVDDLPPEVEFVSSNPGAPTCELLNDKVICVLDSVDSGETVNIDIVIQIISQPANNKVSNTAFLSSNENDPNPGDNTTTIDTNFPDGGTTTGNGGILEGSGNIGCSLNTLASSSGFGTWVMMMSFWGLFVASLRSRRR